MTIRFTAYFVFAHKLVMNIILMDDVKFIILSDLVKKAQKYCFVLQRAL